MEINFVNSSLDDYYYDSEWGKIVDEIFRVSLHNDNIIVVKGEKGSGKTSLLKALFLMLGKNSKVYFIADTNNLDLKKFKAYLAEPKNNVEPDLEQKIILLDNIENITSNNWNDILGYLDTGFYKLVATGADVELDDKMETFFLNSLTKEQSKEFMRLKWQSKHKTMLPFSDKDCENVFNLSLGNPSKLEQLIEGYTPRKVSKFKIVFLLSVSSIVVISLFFVNYMFDEFENRGDEFKVVNKNINEITKDLVIPVKKIEVTKYKKLEEENKIMKQKLQVQLNKNTILKKQVEAETKVKKGINTKLKLATKKHNSLIEELRNARSAKDKVEKDAVLSMFVAEKQDLVAAKLQLNKPNKSPVYNLQEKDILRLPDDNFCVQIFQTNSKEQAKQFIIDNKLGKDTYYYNQIESESYVVILGSYKSMVNAENALTNLTKKFPENILQLRTVSSVKDDIG